MSAGVFMMVRMGPPNSSVAAVRAAPKRMVSQAPPVTYRRSSFSSPAPNC